MDGVVLAHCDDEKDGAGLITTTTTTTTAVAAAAWQQATSPPAESRTELKRMILQIGVKQVNKGEQQSSSSSTILEMEPTSSVGDLKRQIASLQEFDNIPVERQRLIYFGRMLVDNDQALGDAENDKGLKMRSDDGVINYVHLSPLPEGANPSQRTGASVSPSASSPREGPLRYHPTGRTREVPHDLPAPPSVQQTAALHSPTLQVAILRARRLGAQARERRQRQYHPYPTMMMMVHQNYPARGGAPPPGRGVVLDAHHDRRPPSQSPPPPAVSLEYYPPAPTPAQPAPAVQVPPGLVPSRSIPDSVGRPQHDTSSASGTSAESNENRLSTLIAAEIERALEARLAEVQQRRRQRQQSPRARLRADIRREAAQFLPVLAEWYSQIERLVQISPTSSAGDHDDDDLYLEPLLRNMQRNLLPMWNEQLRPLLQFWHEQQRQEQHQQRLRQQEQQQQQQQQQFQQQLQQQRQQYRQQQHHHHQQQQEQHSTSSSSIHVATTNHHPHPSYVNVMRATAYIMFPRPVADHFRYSASALPAVVVAASAAASPTSAPSSPPLVFSPEQHYTV